MTRNQIFKLWPRPWRLHRDHPGSVLDAEGDDVLFIQNNTDEEATALAKLIVEWSNEKP